MGKGRLWCSIHDHRATVVSAPKFSSGSMNVDMLNVKFDNTWSFEEPVSFFAVFHCGNPEDGTAVPLETTTMQDVYGCVIPSEMLATAGIFNFAVFAKNEAGDVVKTSTECRQKVVQGAYTGSPVLIDWQAFKTELIELVNSQFGTDLPESADTSAILAALSSVEMTSAALAELIEAINIKFNAALPESATVADIKTFISSYLLFDEQPLIDGWHSLFTGGLNDA